MLDSTPLPFDPSRLTLHELAAHTSASSMEPWTPAQYAALCAEADGRRARHRAALLTGQVSDFPSSSAPLRTADAEPVIGYRAAADVLGIGREQVRRVVQGLPPHRRPTMVTARGGHDAVWWSSPEACRSWWSEVHTTPAPPPRSRPKRRDPSTTHDSRSLADRLADI